MSTVEPGHCGRCPKRETCTALCEDAENYANQDHAKHEELYLDAALVDTMPDSNWVYSIASNVPLTKRERQIVRLLGIGLSNKDVCEVLEISLNALYVNIHRLKRKAREM